MRKCLLTCVSVAGILAAQGAVAQPNSGTSSTVSEEVIVTARRREERIQDVPISVSAVSGAALEQKGITDIRDLQNAVPSLAISGQSASRSDRGFAIRGQRTQERQILTDPPIGLYFAEVISPRAPGFGNVLYDIDNIQVLKGVQGTLFGRNTTGGAILVEPHHPTNDFEGELRFQAGNYDMKSGYGMFNLPVVKDKLSLRVAGQVKRRDGYTIDLISGRDLDNEAFQAWRGSLLFTPTDNFESLFIYDAQISKTHGTGSILNDVGPGTVTRYLPPVAAGFPPLLPVLAQQQALGNRKLVGSALGLSDRSLNPYPGTLQAEKLRAWNLTNKTTLEVGGLTFKNVFGYRYLNFNRLNDFYNIPIPLIISNITTGSEQLSNEFQIQGKSFEDRLSWIVGTYYFLEDGFDNSNSAQVIHVQRFARGQPQTAPAGNFLSTRNGSGTSKSLAFFAAGTFNLSDHWKISQGIRWTQDKKEGEIESFFGPLNTGPCALAAPQPPDCTLRSPKAKWQHITWDVSLQYQPDPSSNYYVAYRHGYNAGGFNLRTTRPQFFLPFNPEKVNEYELGAKKQWSLNDVAVTTNGAIFLQNYTDRQVPNPVSIGTIIEVITTNTASQKAYGGEFEVTLNFPWGLDLSGLYSYVNISNVTGSSGEFVLRSPKNQVGLSATYELPIDEQYGTVALNYSLSYRSMSHMDDFDTEIDQAGYALSNARLDWDGVLGSGVGLALFANNIFDKDYRVGGVSLLDSFGVSGVIWGEPRMFGGEVSYKF